MASELGCDAYKSMWELIFSTFRTTTATGQNFAAVSLKTAAAPPDECVGKWTVEEKIRSAVSRNCAGDIRAINVVVGYDPCGASSTYLDCSTGDWTQEDYLNSILVYTTDGEWAFNLYSIDEGGRAQ